MSVVLYLTCNYLHMKYLYALFVLWFMTTTPFLIINNTELCYLRWFPRVLKGTYTNW